MWKKKRKEVAHTVIRLSQEISHSVTPADAHLLHSTTFPWPSETEKQEKKALPQGVFQGISMTLGYH